jgi:GntR family transcriptional regulator/MocR family aminotransferase
VPIDRSAPATLRDQIAAGLRDAIAAGRLGAGARLPASRALAGSLGVSRGVIVEAYRDLHQQGHIVVRSRALPRVADRAAPLPPAAGRPPPAPRLDLGPRAPDLSLFPRREWLVSMQAELAAVPDRALDYGDGRGHPGLRRALADHLGRVRGVACDADRIVVCHGAAQGIEIACRVLAGTGLQEAAVEDPCDPAARAAAARAGLRVLPVSVDGDGLRAGLVPAGAIAIATPAHQFPLGALLSGGRRAELLERAAFVVEDDRGGELRHDGRAVGALQAAAPDRVLYVGSASLALVPGVRLAWLVLPRDLVAAAAGTRLALDGGPAVLDQLALARMLETAAFDRHLRRVRDRYRRRRDALAAALAQALPDATVAGGGAGLHLVVTLPDPAVRAELGARAEADRVRVQLAEDMLAHPPATGRALLAGYGRVPRAGALTAARALARLVGPAEERRRRGPRPFAAPAPPPAPIAATPGDAAADLCVMTLDAYGGDPADVPALAAVVRAAGADVVCIQNAGGGAARIADELGWAGRDGSLDVVARAPLVRPAGQPYVVVEVAPGRYAAVANVHLPADRYGPARLLAGEAFAAVAAAEREVRLPQIQAVIATLRRLARDGVPAVLAGMLNTRPAAGWPVADALAAAGFAEAYRGPAVTWPVPGFPADPAEGSDRIDAIHVAGPAVVVSAAIAGERGGEHVDIPVDRWPTDHRSVVASLRLVPGTIAPFAAPAAPLATCGEPLPVLVAGRAPAQGRLALVRAGAPAARAAAWRPAADVSSGGRVALPTRGARPGAYEVVLTGPRGGERSRAPVWLSAEGAAPEVRVGRRIRAGQPVAVSWQDGTANRWDWIGVFSAGADMSAPPLHQRLTGAVPAGSVAFPPLPSGDYVAALVLDDSTDVLALAPFTVVDRFTRPVLDLSRRGMHR